MRAPLAALAFALLSACSLDGDTYTLYRSSVVLDSARIHVATFDAADGEKYNNENCQQAQQLFQAQPRVETRFWCEKGRYRK